MNAKLISTVVVSLAIVGCSERAAQSGQEATAAEGTAPAAGPKIIAIDGSSTVFPITEAMAEEFQKGSDAKVTIGVSGTGGGFKKFCGKETAITGASRPIKPSEVELCGKAGVEYIELPVAYDGIAVVVHKDNPFVDQMTVEELQKLWAPEGKDKVKTWSAIRAGWPDKEIHLFGPGVDSGTYDYFTKAIVGKEHSSRGDFTSSEDDNVLVQGISTDPLALGFFGYAYYAENAAKLKLVPIDDGKPDNGAGAIAPSPKTVEDGTYQPLARPIFVYVNKAAAQRQEIKDFVHYYLGAGTKLVNEVGYIALPADAYKAAVQRFDSGTTGSVFAGEGSRIGVSITDLLKSES